jgi:uncharacterized protein
VEKLSLDEARRIALHAQGFADKRPSGRVDRRHLRKVFDRIGLIQIDSVNVLVRSQELPLFARLGPHPRTLIADATNDGELFEYWAHEAAHVPVAHHHLHRFKMELGRANPRWRRYIELRSRRPQFVDDVLRRIERDGPVVAGDVSERVGPKGAWWDWDDGKVALEYLFLIGEITARRRGNDFARVYDVSHRVLPARVLATPTPTEAESRRELLGLAAHSLGVATASDLCDYHRQNIPLARPYLAELVEDGRLIPVKVDGWSQPAFLDPAYRAPRSIQASSLLSPFDSLVWNRDRTERLFGFHYRIEIYVPEPKRQYGYYVLPFMHRGELVARVDLKADRQRGALLAKGIFGEPGIPVADVAAALAVELQSMADWLGLDRVEVGINGDMAIPVGRVIHSATAEARVDWA